MGWVVTKANFHSHTDFLNPGSEVMEKGLGGALGWWGSERWPTGEGGGMRRGGRRSERMGGQSKG